MNMISTADAETLVRREVHAAIESHLSGPNSGEP
jgi:hypothetical protein